MLKKLTLFGAIPVFVVACMLSCDVDKTREGEMPDVDVDVEGGQLPAYDVETPDVDVRGEERTIEVPDVDVDVDSEERTITVPDVDVTMPDEKLEPGEVDPS